MHFIGSQVGVHGKGGGVDLENLKREVQAAGWDILEETDTHLFYGKADK